MTLFVHQLLGGNNNIFVVFLISAFSTDAQTEVNFKLYTKETDMMFHGLTERPLDPKDVLLINGTCYGLRGKCPNTEFFLVPIFLYLD